MCLKTRAMHLEVLDSLGSSAYMMAFLKFADLRGCSTHIYSDNTSTFVGGAKELRLIVESLNPECIRSSFAVRGIQWHFSSSLI